MVTGPPVGPLDAGRATSGAVGGVGLSLIITVPKCLCINIRLEKKNLSYTEQRCNQFIKIVLFF